METAGTDKRCPVAFNHETPEHAKTWAEQYQEMRGNCPVAWTEAHGGYWVVSRYKDVVAMAQDDATFSSFKTFDAATMEVAGGITIPPTPLFRGLPVEADRPEWDGFRSFINRRFAPKAAEARRENVRKYAIEMLDRVIETGQIDFVEDLTGPVPALTTMELIGLPLHEWRDFADPLHQVVAVPKTDPRYEQIITNVAWTFERCAEELHIARRQPPKDGLLSYFAHEKIGDRYLTDEEVLSYCQNILFGGVDTTTALTTNVLRYLHDEPSEKQRLIDDPSLIPTAREEFVRYFAPIHALARNVTRDVDQGGVHMEKGDHVLLSWSAANRDPEIFENPNEIDMARFPNRHIGFGAGMHRCVGSFLARVMFEEMITQVLARIPDYRIDIAAAEPYQSVGTINGWVNMPATFKPGSRIGTDINLQLK